MSKFKAVLLGRLYPFFRTLAVSTGVFFCLLVLLRFFEYTFLVTNGIIQTTHLWVIIKSLNYDLNACSLFLLVSAPLLVMPSVMFPKATIKFYSILLICFLFVTILLNYYFYINKELLGFNVFSYSFEEISLIVSHEFINLNLIFVVFSVLLFSGAIYLLVFKLDKFTGKTFKGDWAIVVVFLIVGAINLSQLKYSSPISREYKEAVEYNLAYNKVDYIIRGGIISAITSSDIELDSMAVVSYRQVVPADYVSDEYPFLRNREETNVLGEFFEKKTQSPPNILFVICEGLSRSFSGPEAKYKGITPFLDSLVDQSLYWRNFVSNNRRTYGVLPNALGSLPYGNRSRGFTTLELPYPNHQTLVSLLVKQGYHSGFYYPGWSGFDKIDRFMFLQGITENYDQKNIEAKTPKNNQWGYSDQQFFEFYLSQFPLKKAPFVDVLMTLSIHAPFDQVEEKHIEKVKDYANNFKEETLSDMDKRVLASAMYFDDCMRYLLNELKKSKNFENTIVIITGDHNVQNIALRNELDRFYVPMYMVSPLLAGHKNMGGVCSHLNITPSLTQLLNKTYELPMPKLVAYVGTELDTSAAFNADKIFPLEIYNEGLGQYVYKDLLLANDQVYRIGDNLSMTPNHSATVDLVRLKNDYIELDKYVSKQNKLIK